MSNIFQNLELQAFRAGIQPRTKESIAWFQKKAADLRRINREQLMKEKPLDTRSQVRPGNMFMFFYDPKHKETLPYYDRFPLIIMVDSAPKGFYGMNLHYLPPTLRAKFLDQLLDITNNKSFDETTRFKLSYELLKGSQKFKYFKPCFKHYLTSQVRSKFAYVAPPEWEIATFLPTANFAKANKNAVYRDSRRII